jgi:ribosomal protein L21
MRAAFRLSFSLFRPSPLLPFHPPLSLAPLSLNNQLIPVLFMQRPKMISISSSSPTALNAFDSATNEPQDSSPFQPILDETHLKQSPPDRFAVTQVGGKQYKVVVGDVIVVEKLEYAEVGQNILLQKVLLFGSHEYSAIGRPLLPTATILAHVEEQTSAQKVRIFKMKRRKNYRRNVGRRHPITTLRILAINFDPVEEHSKSPLTIFRYHNISQL